MKNFFKNLGRIFYVPVKEEIKEIVNLEPTKQDFEQGEKLAVIVTAVLNANGVPMSAHSTYLMGKALAYLVRDVKDGVDQHDRLLIQRIAREVKKSLYNRDDV